MVSTAHYLLLYHLHLVSFIALCGQDVSAWHSERQNTGDSKIVGGTDTDINRVPYLVNLRLRGRFICGGSLLTVTCVLTAAHCVQGVVPTELSVQAGTSLLTQPGQERKVQNYFSSPFYTARIMDSDVAILKLASPIGGKNIATIPLCAASPAKGQFVRISGWGVTNENNRDPPNRVRTANVRVVSQLDCQLTYAGNAAVTSTMFCATEPGIKDSCSGDSGGPVVYDGRVCGIVSWGIGCARSKYPGVYTNVSSRRVNTFIRQTLASSCL